jgi:hypothetical protein
MAKLEQHSHAISQWEIIRLIYRLLKNRLQSLFFNYLKKKFFWEHGRPVISHCDWKRKIIFEILNNPVLRKMKKID